jgi:D-glycerate 3-kinase
MSLLKKKDLELSFRQKLRDMMLGDELMEDLDRIYLPMANLIKMGLNTQNRTQVIGINGAQGAGKTTFSQLLQVVLEIYLGMRVVRFSIDDFYVSRSEREKLAAEVHPLLITRGVPGTHDVKLCEQVIEQLSSANEKSETIIPRFNKATDEPYPESQWEKFVGRPNVILFDGWFVGAVAQKETELLKPVNDLERNEDPYCIWRRYVNSQLKENYHSLFDKIDLLVMLKVPSFDKIYEWRTLQEQKLRLRNVGEQNLRIMSDEEIKRFIGHYERLTRHVLEEMLDRADMLFNVSSDHRICL